MRCEQIQPDLLDYSKGQLTGRESESVKLHLKTCAGCRAVLEEEVAFSGRLAALADEGPQNDVWALVRARTRPRRVQPVAWLRGMLCSNLRRAAAASVAATVLLAAVLTFNPHQQTTPVTGNTAPAVTVKWSDDPLGGHTDAMVDAIGNM